MKLIKGIVVCLAILSAASAAHGAVGSDPQLSQDAIENMQFEKSQSQSKAQEYTQNYPILQVCSEASMLSRNVGGETGDDYRGTSYWSISACASNTGVNYGEIVVECLLRRESQRHHTHVRRASCHVVNLRAP